MEVVSVHTTSDMVRAQSACEELRAHGIKCDIFEPNLPDIGTPYSGPSPGIQVVVAPEDEDRADKILDAWAAGR